MHQNAREFASNLENKRTTTTINAATSDSTHPKQTNGVRTRRKACVFVFGCG
jgi:hypothetical protein